MIRAEPNYGALADAVEDLDQQIEALQGAKKDIIGNLREEHGRIIADAFKAAMKIRRMDSEKRAKAEEIDAEAFRILGILNALRATRVENKGKSGAEKRPVNLQDDPEHDAETGEIIEHQSREENASLPTAKPEPVDPPSAGSGAPSPLAVVSPAEKAPEPPPQTHGSGAIIPDELIVPHIRKDHVPTNPSCQKPATCKWARSMASCSACANAAAAKRKLVTA